MIYLCSISTKASTASKQQQGKTKKWLEIHPNKKREKKHNYFADCQMSPKFFFLLSIFPKTELQRTDQIWVSELRNAPLLWVAFSKCHWGGWDEINTAMQRTSKEQKSAKMVKEFFLLLSELQYWLSQWLLMSKLNNLYEKESLWKISRNFPSTKHTSFFS